ncbi:MAG: mannose-6-phosphate isomerase, class I [Propionibacteriaceae bacterium]
MIERLTGVVQPYAWGSTTALPRLLGVEPTGEPQAELWLGAHPLAPAQVGDRDLDEVVSEDAARVVGEASVAQFGPRLPYLLKVLAMAQPLSLQAHPSRSQAEAGWDRENDAGIARDAVERSYKDGWPKPEALVAIEPTEVLCGFREPAQTYALLARLGVPAALQLLAPLQHAAHDGAAEALESVFGALLRLDRGTRRDVVDALVESAADADDRTDDLGLFARTATELARFYPGDPGILAALMMNRLVLDPYDALFLPAGNLHAYLHGLGVEIMANSDNVLRGGLTPKPIAVDELLSVLDFTPGVPQPVDVVEEAAGVFAYQTPAPEFALWRIEGTEIESILPGAGTGRVVLVTDGRATLRGVGRELVLSRGQSAFVSAREGETELVGAARTFVAAPGVR